LRQIEAAAMISLAGWLSPTRIVGLAAYFFATTSCCIAWVRNLRAQRSGRLAAYLGLLEAGLFIDMAFNGRWMLHDLLEDEAISRSLYAQRTGPQVALLGFLGAATAISIGLVIRALGGKTGASVAACGAIFSLSCWCAEVISLHAIDAVFYANIDGLMVVSLCWIGGSLMTGLGILWESKIT